MSSYERILQYQIIPYWKRVKDGGGVGFWIEGAAAAGGASEKTKNSCTIAPTIQKRKFVEYAGKIECKAKKTLFSLLTVEMVRNV